MKRSTGILLATGTGIASFIAYYYFARWTKIDDPWFYASMVLLSVLVHELCHLVAFERFGIKTHLVFLVIVGGAMPDPEYVRKMNHLPASKRIIVFLAGVCGNLLIVLACAALALAGLMNAETFGRIMNLNGGLVLLNLLPVATLDGGRFASLFFESIPKKLDPMYEKLLATICAGGLIAIMIATKRFFPVPALLLVWGLKKKSELPHGHDAKRLMVKERFGWMGVYVTLILVGAAMSYSTPDFVKKHHANSGRTAAVLFS